MTRAGWKPPQTTESHSLTRRADTRPGVPILRNVAQILSVFPLRQSDTIYSQTTGAAGQFILLDIGNTVQVWRHVV